MPLPGRHWMVARARSGWKARWCPCWTSPVCCGPARSPAQIEAVIGPLAEAEADARRSPGRLALHYAPEAPVRLNAGGPREGEAYLAFGAPGPFSLSENGDLREAAANLFRLVRAADRTRPAGIAVAPIPDTGLGEAINDRLKRAAGFVG